MLVLPKQTHTQLLYTSRSWSYSCSFFVCVRFIFLPFIVIFFPPGINCLIYCEVVGKTDFFVVVVTCITSWAMTITEEKNHSFLISLQDKLHYIKSVYIFEPISGLSILFHQFVFLYLCQDTSFSSLWFCMCLLWEHKSLLFVISSRLFASYFLIFFLV